MRRANQSVVTEFIFQGLSSQPRTQTVLFVVFLAFYLLTLVGNTVVILVIRADRQLKSPMYFFLANLSFLDICYISCNVPQMLVNLLSEKKTISFSGCAVQMYFSLAFGMTECFLLGVMAYDSILIVFIPFLFITTSYVRILSAILKIHSARLQAKTFSTCGSHLMVVTIFYGTAICMYMNPRARAPQDGDKVVAVFYTIVAPMLNPFIYSLRNKDMEHALRRALKRPKSLFL
ncbi:olfactory receptor 1030 isoform X2 [Calypte anna]|uniref:olfactory receptor 1030 isoform X2 n=1 Tax=Calypte anna TaxID=9244 RepID=UPI0011C4651C|nr:olfactory receptor 1030 isoform X2 [Calypte anna]